MRSPSTLLYNLYAFFDGGLGLDGEWIMDHVAFRLQLGGTRAGFQWNCYTLDTPSDKYGRTLADMLLRMGTNVNHVLVTESWCLGYRKYTLGNTS